MGDRGGLPQASPSIQGKVAHALGDQLLEINFPEAKFDAGLNEDLAGGMMRGFLDIGFCHHAMKIGGHVGRAPAFGAALLPFREIRMGGRRKAQSL